MANPTPRSLAEEASSYLAKSTCAVEGISGSETEIRRQSDLLVRWAQERGVFLADGFLVGLERRNHETTEHEIFYRESDGRAIKLTYAGSFGFTNGPSGKLRKSTPLLYLQRILLMDREFPSDLRLEGVILRAPRFDINGEKRPSIVTSQQWIEAADENDPHPTEVEIKEFMEFFGYCQSEDSNLRWYHKSGTIMVSDAKRDNFIKSPEGVIAIDLIISEVIGLAP